MSYDPSEQRAVIQGIAVTDVVPEDATILGEVLAERCHQNWYDPIPGEVALKVDLQMSAYSSGADGIAEVAYDDEGVSSSGQSCWKIYTARATAYITGATGH